MYRFNSLYTITILATLLFFSCKDRGQTPDELNQALSILENDPQKAKELLNNIPNPDNMVEADYMQYQLAYIEAKDRTYDDIKNDSIILRISSYYDQEGNIEKGAYAHFYTGAYYYDNKQYDKALESYLMANYKAAKSKNLLLTGKSQHGIGIIYFYQGLPDSATIYYDKAIEVYKACPNTQDMQMSLLNSMALLHYKDSDYDTAINLYQQAASMASQQNNNKLLAEFLNNIGSVYCDAADYTQSKHYLYKALPLATNSADSTRLYLNLARVYNSTNQLDSVQYFSKIVTNNAKNVTYKPTLRLIYRLVSEYNAKIGNHEESMRYMELRNQINDEILNEQSTDKLIDANARFTLILQEEALARQRIWTCALLLVALLVIIGIIMYFKHKKRQVELENKLLTKEKLQFKLENELIQQQCVSLLTTLNTYEDIFKSRKEIWNAIYNEKERKKIDELFEKIRKNADELFDEWSKNHLKTHPCSNNIMFSLSNEELRIMHLAFLENPPEIIANMLGLEYNEEDMQHRIATIRDKLAVAGMTSIEINAIFKEKSNQ